MKKIIASVFALMLSTCAAVAPASAEVFTDPTGVIRDLPLCRSDGSYLNAFKIHTENGADAGMEFMIELLNKKSCALSTGTGITVMEEGAVAVVDGKEVQLVKIRLENFVAGFKEGWLAISKAFYDKKKNEILKPVSGSMKFTIPIE